MRAADEINQKVVGFLRPYLNAIDHTDFTDTIPPLDHDYIRALCRFERGEVARSEVEAKANALAVAWVRLSRRMT